MDEFLKIAQKYQLEGLTAQEEEDIKADVDEEHYKEESLVNLETPVRTKQRKSFGAKEEMSPHSSVVSVDPNNSTTEVTKQMIQENVEFSADGSAVCTICGKTAQGNQARGIMKQHMETHMQGVSFPCDICGKSFRSKHSLSNHKSLKHRSTKY